MPNFDDRPPLTAEQVAELRQAGEDSFDIIGNPDRYQSGAILRGDAVLVMREHYMQDVLGMAHKHFLRLSPAGNQYTKWRNITWLMYDAIVAFRVTHRLPITPKPKETK